MRKGGISEEEITGIFNRTNKDFASEQKIREAIRKQLARDGGEVTEEMIDGVIKRRKENSI